MATIRDVADHAGVSVATVSHVINESRFVRPETKARVRAAIEALDYQLDGIARSLRRSRTGTIGVVISDITNPFFADLVKGIEETAHNLDDKINLFLCNTEEDIERERVYLDVLQEKRVDGLIIAPAGGNEAYLKRLVEKQFPIVFVDRRLPGVEADTILVDNIEATRGIVAMLTERGYTRIAAIRADLTANSIHERMEGYRKALEIAGLQNDPTLEFNAASDIDSAFLAAKRLLNTKPLPQAVFCTNNFMTLGMMRALNEAGLACPDDIAIAGFDDFPWAEAFRPRLAAVAQPAFEMGQKAAILLDERLSKKRTGQAVHITLPAEIHVRESMGPAPRTQA